MVVVWATKPRETALKPEAGDVMRTIVSRLSDLTRVYVSKARCFRCLGRGYAWLRAGVVHGEDQVRESARIRII